MYSVRVVPLICMQGGEDSLKCQGGGGTEEVLWGRGGLQEINLLCFGKRGSEWEVSGEIFKLNFGALEGSLEIECFG